MFRQTWKKYMPAIIILMKRSIHNEQILDMNHTDFERAAGGRKIKFSFSNLILINGRYEISAKHPVLAMDLALLMQEEEQTQKLLLNRVFEFSMTGNFQLSIKNSTAVQDQLPGTNNDPGEGTENNSDSVL